MGEAWSSSHLTIIVSVICGVLALVALFAFWLVFRSRARARAELPSSSSTSRLWIKNPKTNPSYSSPSVQMGAASPLFIQSVPSSLSFLGSSLTEKPPHGGEYLPPATPRSLPSVRSSFCPPCTPVPPLSPSSQPAQPDDIVVEVQIDNPQTHHSKPSMDTASVYSCASMPRTARTPTLWRSRSRKSSRKKSSDTTSMYSTISAPHDQHDRILSSPPSYPPPVPPLPQDLLIPATLAPALSTSTSDGLLQAIHSSRTSSSASDLPVVTPGEIERILDRMMRASTVDPVLPHADQPPTHTRHRLGSDSLPPTFFRQSMHVLTTAGLPHPLSLPRIEPLSAYPRLEYSPSSRGHGALPLRSIRSLRVRPLGPRKLTV